MRSHAQSQVDVNDVRYVVVGAVAPGYLTPE